MTTPDFEFIYSAYESTLLKDAYDAITACNLWDWMRSYTPDEGSGFTFSNHPNLDRIHKKMKLYDMHSGGSYGWTMRQMESIAKRGWDEYRNAIRQKRAEDKLKSWADEQRRSPCACRLARGYTTGWCGVAGGGVPACDH